MVQVVNPRSKTQQGHSVTKLETPLQNILAWECQHDTGSSIKQVQSGILKKGLMTETSLGGV